MALRIQTVLKVALLLLGCAVLGALLVCILQLRAAVIARSPKIDAALSNAGSLTWNASAAAFDAESYLSDPETRQAVRLVRHDTVEITGEWARTSKHLAATTQAMVDQEKTAADKTIEAATKITNAVSAASEDLHAVSKQSVATLKTANDDLIEGRDLIFDIDKVTKNPNLSNFFDNLNQSSVEFHGLMVNLDSTSGDLRAYVHRLTKPVGTAKSIGLHLAGFGEGVVAKLIP